MKTFKDMIQESNNADIMQSIKGKKTSTGVKVEDLFDEYLEALQKVASLPSAIKPYIDGGFPAKNEINDAVDAVNKVLKKIG